MSNNAETGLSDAELAWQKQFVFDHHETVGIYKRKVSFEVDTASWKDFNTALADETATSFMSKESTPVDDGRYSFLVKLNAEPGYMAIYLQPLKGLFTTDSLPRAVNFTLSVRVPGAQKPLATIQFNRTYDTYLGFGWPKFVSLAVVRTDSTFKALTQKHLLVKTEIEECASSGNKDFLPQPTLDFKRVVSSLNHALSHEGDAIADLSDGQSTIHSTLLEERCDHFKSVFSADFQEAQPSIIRTTESEVSSDNTECLNSSLVECIVLSDSDCDDEAVGQHRSLDIRQELKIVKFPNFSKATFDAFVLYLYTGSITFKPIKSFVTGLSQLPNHVAMRSVLKGKGISSPKSMYAMADYFDVPALKELSKSAFLAMIHPGNLLWELARPFGRLHKPISEALEDYAVENWSQITATSTFGDDVQTVMEYEQSRKIFTNILQKASKK